MSNNVTIARPYAKAAFAVATQDGTISAWSNLLNTAAMVVRDPRIVAVLKNPQFTLEQKFNCIADVCKKVMHEAGRNFFKLLAEQNRLLLLPEIDELFETYRIEQEKSINAQVTSAIELSAAEKERLEQALKIRLQRNITLECHVDKNLLGGTIIRAGDLVIDGSVRGKLARLNTVLMNEG